MNQFFNPGPGRTYLTLTSLTSHKIHYVTDEQKSVGTFPLKSTDLAKQLYKSYYNVFGTLSLFITATEPKIDA